MNKLSETTSDERSKRVTSNIDLQELGVEDVSRSNSKADETPKSAQVNPKPIFNKKDPLQVFQTMGNQDNERD